MSEGEREPIEKELPDVQPPPAPSGEWRMRSRRVFANGGCIHELPACDECARA